MTEKIESIDDLFVHDLRDIHSAEEQLITALRKMAAAADTPELSDAFTRHLEQTTHHRQRIEQALNELNAPVENDVCEGVQGLITEAEERISATQPGPVLDAALIDSARKVEHYEITAYRSALSRAHELGHDRVASLLEMNLQEEELTDFRLQQLAEGMMPYSGPGADPRDDGSEVMLGQ
jgi:ferritin-like metal-binding protein YciE